MPEGPLPAETGQGQTPPVLTPSFRLSSMQRKYLFSPQPNTTAVRAAPAQEEQLLGADFGPGVRPLRPPGGTLTDDDNGQGLRAAGADLVPPGLAHGWAGSGPGEKQGLGGQRPQETSG